VFKSATDLTSVTFEADSTLTTIGEHVFNNSGLTSITIPNSVTSIGDYAFYGAEKLETISLGINVTYLGHNVFNNALKLESISLGNIIKSSITSIGINAFKDAKSLTSITIPHNVTSIGQQAFWGASSLKTVTFGDNSQGKYSQINSQLVTIGEDAFKDATSLTSIIIPYYVTTIGKDAFVGSGLTTAYVSANLILTNGWTNGGVHIIGGKTNVTIFTTSAPLRYLSYEQPITKMDSGMRTRMLKMNANNLGKVNKSRGNEESGTILHNNINSHLQKTRNSGCTVPKKVINKPTI
jgi:hypothetical protein